jgi:hypothetical protein
MFSLSKSSHRILSNEAELDEARNQREIPDPRLQLGWKLSEFGEGRRHGEVSYAGVSWFELCCKLGSGLSKSASKELLSVFLVRRTGE